MNNVQFYLAMGLPTFMVLIGIFLNQRSMDRLEQRMDRLEARIETRLDRIEAYLREFYRTLGQHDARLDNLENRGSQA
jgi:uncharacterized coiled-coil protein SlyX